MEKLILHVVDFQVLDLTVISEIRRHSYHDQGSLAGILAEYISDISLLNFDLRMKYNVSMIAEACIFIAHIALINLLGRPVHILTVTDKKLFEKCSEEVR